jgi:hypothetical protein
MLIDTATLSQDTLNTTILHLRYSIDTAICYATTLLLYSNISAMISWYSNTPTTILVLIPQYAILCYPCYSTTTILLHDFCTATLDTAIPHYDPHTDTTIWYDTIPLIIQKSTSSETNTTAIPQIQYLSDITNNIVQLINATCSKETIPPILTDNNIQR